MNRPKLPDVVTITEQEYAGLMAQASFLRAAVYALGGVYEVSFETMINHGRGEMQLEADQTRKTIIVKLIQGPHEEPPQERYNEPLAAELSGRASLPADEAESPPMTRSEATSDRVASSAAKVLRSPTASRDAKAAAASALTQKQGRKRITERPGVETDD